MRADNISPTKARTDNCALDKSEITIELFHKTYFCQFNLIHIRFLMCAFFSIATLCAILLSIQFSFKKRYFHPTMQFLVNEEFII